MILMHAGVPSVSLDQTSPVDVLSGNAVCSNTTVEFTCIANNVETLGWHVNDRHIASWHVRSNVKPVDDGRVEAYLDLNDTIINEGQFNTVTSKLVSSVDQSLLNGDEIRCEGTTNMNVEDSLVLNYSIVNGK